MTITISTLAKWLGAGLFAIALTWAGWVSNSVVNVYHLPEKVNTIQTDVNAIQVNVDTLRKDMAAGFSETNIAIAEMNVSIAEMNKNIDRLLDK